MPSEVLTTLAQSAAQTVAAAAVTDVWESVRSRFARLFGRGNVRRAEAAEAWLAQTWAQLTSVEPGTAGMAEQAQQAVVHRWAARFADLLDEDPAVETELRALIEEVTAQLPAGTALTGDSSLAAGRDLRITASRGGIAYGAVSAGISSVDLPSRGSISLSTIERMIDLIREAVDVDAAAKENSGAYISADLGAALHSRYLATGSLADLDASIAASQEAIAAIDSDDQDRSRILAALGVTLQSRYERVGDSSDLDLAIDLLREAIDRVPGDHLGRPAMLSNMAAALQSRYERVGDSSDLDLAIDLLREAIDRVPGDHLGRPAMLSNMAAALRKRFERSGDAAELDAAVTLLRAAVEATYPGHPDRLAMLSNMAAALQSRYDRVTHNLADLDDAIALLRAVIESSPAGHPDRLAMLSNMAAALSSRYERTGNTADLNEATALLREAIASVPQGNPILTRLQGQLTASNLRNA